ncbi:hypothetical protein [Chryseobacterium sp.]|uniref:hypothetical protein n=1 Tax=Chryseobacterium sp. TaxID=1871047 RepID=UPI0025C4B3DB|nr:hypothetical protein [Chryseobacterium sp.]
MKKYIIYAALLTVGVISGELHAQIGVNTTNIEDGVMMQLESTNKGVLFPRLALSSRTSVSPLNASIPTGTIVFNTTLSGSFPNIISPGLHWWSAEEKQWTNLSTNLENVTAKYVNAENVTNYNTTAWQNVQLFGSEVFNESESIYNVNSNNHTVTLGMSGLYSISTLLSFDRLTADNPARLSMTARLYVNDQPVGTEQVFSPGYTTSINNNRGLFSHSFTEYIELNKGDVLSVKIKKTAGTYANNYGVADVKFLQSGDSSIALLRIR